MNRTVVTVLAVLIVLALAWFGLQMVSWRLRYYIPGFGLGLIVGVGLTVWLGRRRRGDRRGPARPVDDQPWF